jgi:WD40 repeat protein
MNNNQNKVMIVSDNGRVACMFIQDHHGCTEEHIYREGKDEPSHRMRIAINCVGTEAACQSVDSSSSIDVWNLETSDAFELSADGGGVSDLQYSPSDSAVLMTTQWGSKVKIWNTKSRCLTSEFAADDATFTAIGIRSRFNEVIVGDLFSSLNLWGNCLQPLDNAVSSSWSNTVLALHQQVQVHLRAVESICISNDGAKLVSDSSDCTIAMTETPSHENASMRVRFLFKGHEKEINCVRFNITAEVIVSCSDDKTTKLWDGGTGGCLATFMGHSSFVNSVCFVDNDRYVYSAAYDRSICVWDRGQLVHPTASLRDVARTEDGEGDFRASSLPEDFTIFETVDVVTWIVPVSNVLILM